MITKFRCFLGSEIDNAPLILWRVFWGLLIFAESVGAILTGWVQELFIETRFNFTFIGFEWLEPLPGSGMLYYYGVMAVLGFMISVGYRYRLASVLFFVMWTSVYLMQKSHYNNHYYLMVIIGGLMSFLPANADYSMDAKSGRVKRSNTCLNWNVWLFILLIGLIYICASLNKIHTDWLLAKPLRIWFSYKSNYPLLGGLLAKDWFAYVIAWGGIFYDGLIVFLLLSPRTRKLGFALSLIFNLFNSAVFQIGVFPYMMIASTVFFFPGETLRNIFLRKSKPPTDFKRASMPIGSFTVFCLFFLINSLLPIRHHLFPGDVHWTEEGHRLSWQMMLRAKSFRIRYHVEDKKTGERELVKLNDHLSRNQRADFGGKPDMIWQFAQYLKKHYSSQGKDVGVYVSSKVSLNGSGYYDLIDSDVDLASVPWERFKHSDWILDENRPTE